MDQAPALREFERELLELISMSGEPTTVLDEEMLYDSPGRAVVAATLRGLLARRLVRSERAVNAPARDGERVHANDWWQLTRAGRAAIGPAARY